MGYGLGTPLLQDQQPSAPPLGGHTPPHNEPSYPQIPHLSAPGGYPVQPYQPGYAAVGVPAQQQQQQTYTPPPVAQMHHSQLPQGPALVEHQTVCVHLSEHPTLTRIHSQPRMHTCPACHSSGPTLVRRESGCMAWLAAFGMCWLCCPLFWLPFCLDCDKDLVHRCGVCGTEIARVRPFT